MSDDQPLESRRELENLKQRYQEHRRSVRHLLQTAPDERLAAKYEETLTELQRAVDQLDRIDRQTPPERSERPPNEQFDPNRTRSIKPGAIPVGNETVSIKPKSRFDEAELSAGGRSWNDPLVKDETEPAPAESVRSGSGSGLPWVVGIIILLAVAIGIYLAWPEGDATEPPSDEAGIAEEQVAETVEEPPAPRALGVEPASYDYGVIPKGTRSVHRFTLANRTDAAMNISVSRSDCRCLWYDYPGEIPAGGSVELAITVDGARAETGALAETVTVSSESSTDAVAEISLTAEIQQR